MNLEELKQITVLQAMDHQALAGLAASLESRDLSDGQTVFNEGDPGDSMYFLVSGRVRIEKRAGVEGASRKTLTVLESGDYFGEMSLFDQKPRSAAAVAEGPVRILCLSKAAFDSLHQQGGQAGMSVLFAMIQTSSNRIRRLSSHLVVYDEIGKAIGEAPDLQALLDVILQQLSNASDADWGLLLLRSQFSDRLEVRSQVNLRLTAAQVEAACLAQGFIGLGTQNPEGQLVSNFNEEQVFQSCERLGFETPSLLLYPIALEGQLLGLIVLGGKERNQFDLNMLNLARGVARQAAQAILNARHREEEIARSRHSRQFVRF